MARNISSSILAIAAFSLLTFGIPTSALAKECKVLAVGLRIVMKGTTPIFVPSDEVRFCEKFEMELIPLFEEARRVFKVRILRCEEREDQKQCMLTENGSYTRLFADLHNSRERLRALVPAKDLLNELARLNRRLGEYRR